MSSVIGVVTPDSPAVPAGGIIEEVTVEDSVEVKTIRGSNGETAVAAPMGYKKTVTTCRGKGDGTSIFANVASGEYADGASVTEIKHSESNEDVPSFEVAETAYTNL